MVYVDYANGKVILKPENIDDNEKVIESVRTIPSVAYSGGKWTIDEDYVGELNTKLIPIADILLVQKSFKDFIAKKKIKPSASGVVIRCGVINSIIIGKNIPHEAFEDVTKYFWKPAVRDKRFIDKKWDGYIKLYKKSEHSFPTGLLYKIIGVLLEKHIKYDIVYLYDLQPARQFDWVIKDSIIPDPDQIDAIEKAYEGRRGVVKAPTGFGKTAILAKRLTVKFGVPTLFVANKKALLDDAAEEFLTGIGNLDSIVQIKEGNFGMVKVTKDTVKEDIPNIESNIVVATIQSLHARLHDPRTKDQMLYWLNNICKFVMVDECQAVGTKIWSEVLDECKAPYRIFLSATP